MKKIGYFSTLLCLLLVLTLFVSCSTYKGSSEDVPHYNDNSGSGFSSDNMEESVDGSTDVPETAQKIIQNLYLTFEVEKVDTAYETLKTKAISLGGYEFSKNFEKSGDYQSIYAVLKVPSEKLPDFSKDAEKIGNIIHNELTSEDISESYYDVQTRLTTMEKTLQKYYEFLEQANSLEEQLTVTRQIDTLTYEIEALKGKIAKWDNQVNYATVTLRIYEYNDPTLKRKEIHWNSLSADDMWYLIKSGFTGFTSFVVSALQWIVIAIASTAIFTVPAIILVIWLIVRSIKKKKARKCALQQQQTVNTDEKKNDG